MLVSKYVRNENTLESQPLKGMTMISAMRYEVVIQPPSSIPAPIPPWISASDAPTTWILRMARNAPIVEPTTATQVLSDTCSRAGSPGAPCATGAARTRAAVLDMRHCAAQPAWYRWKPPPTFPAATDRSAAGSNQGGS